MACVSRRGLAGLPKTTSLYDWTNVCTVLLPQWLMLAGSVASPCFHELFTRTAYLLYPKLLVRLEFMDPTGGTH